ncbi:hypothetical protein [Paraliomyxa miuraensis]|uniref:hypothetical protein n=1 Tax=Paraliomyxa miuraensis TaxID=376150 RepID=UPI0022574774|nr:hypothetical protein [Paraliomyxa miuraensis]MCX4243849.1 hypothetical protein [Paraliomyxa miuraensis]
MAQVNDYKLHRVLARFPWRRRKPRSGQKGRPPIGLMFREGQKLWADPGDLARFEDPGPALVCVAMHADETAHDLLRALVEHHAEQQGIDLPLDVPDITTTGLQLLAGLIEDAGLDPEHALGPHALGDLITATWAIAAAQQAAANV